MDRAKCMTGELGMNILIVDDEASLRRTLRIALESMGHEVNDASGSARCDYLIHQKLFDVSFIDLRLAQEQGFDVLAELKKHCPILDVVIITAYATIETAVEAMRRGAFDVLPKPFTPDQLRLLLQRCAQ